MKKALTIIILFISISFFCKSLFANSANDTTFTYYNASWQPTHFLGIAYFSKQWVENGLYFRNDYYYPSMMLQMTGSYSDTIRKIKQGLFVFYYGNGVKKGSTFFKNGKEEGVSLGWYENGQLASKHNYKNGILLDTSYSYYYNPTSRGRPIQITICNEKGSGSAKFFFEDGKERGGGNMLAGKKHGKWTFLDNNSIVSQILVYEMDSVMQITNFDESGKLESKNKTLEKASEFPGGINGWRSFLEENLKYPNYAQRKGIEGIVKVAFTVDTDGKPLDIHILYGPDKSLEKESLRIMKLSPNWIPAIQYNRKVTYRFVQTITFQLQ